ncbi:ABC-2 transporter permease [uncultured Ruminococcus sp.]|uniref:ABC-2 transporter permease n=1 Tax=uncultured Ruminococcus sp. TaxID=165186 RepID=UPI0025EB2E07|nr:ABC-2 transporter permease [uncultured Ruminococcus sp.]
MEKKIKALILSDWYSMKIIYISLAVMYIFCGIAEFATAAGTGTAVLSFMSILAGLGTVLVSTVFAADEWKGIGAYRRSMPYSDKELVLSRYLPPMCLCGAVVVLTMLFPTIGGLVHGSFSNNFGGQMMFAVVLKAIFMTLPVVIFYPLFFRLGYKKTQVIYSVVTALMMLQLMMISVVGNFTVVFDEMDEEKKTELSPLMTMPIPAGIITIAVLCGLWYLSYRLSLKGIKKRDV